MVGVSFKVPFTGFSLLFPMMFCPTKECRLIGAVFLSTYLYVHSIHTVILPITTRLLQIDQNNITNSTDAPTVATTFESDFRLLRTPRQRIHQFDLSHPLCHPFRSRELRRKALPWFLDKPTKFPRRRTIFLVLSWVIGSMLFTRTMMVVVACAICKLHQLHWFATWTIQYNWHDQSSGRRGRGPGTDQYRHL